MNAAQTIKLGTVIRFRQGGDCRVVEIEGPRVWFESTWNQERSMAPAYILAALIRDGHAVDCTADYA